MNLLAIVADIDGANLGGAEWHFVEVVKRIIPSFENVTIVTGPKNGLSNQFNNFKNVDIITVQYPHITNFYGILFILFALPKLVWQVLFKKQYDVIWAKQEFPQGVIAGILKILFKIPIYLTCQSARLHKDELVIKGHLPSFVKEILVNLAGLMIGFSFRKANIVGAVSSFSRLNAKSMGAENVVVVPNGVNTDYFTFTKRTIGEKLKIVTTSSLIERNAVDVLIKSCALLPDAINWQLSIAGSGPEESAYKNMAKSLRIDSRVNFLGRVKNSEIPKLLEKSDIFVRLSRAEGFGSSFLEAMATGLPVVATPVGGIVDFIENSKTGLLVPVNDPTAAARAIQDLIGNKKLYAQLQINAYSLVMKEYNWEKISEIVLTQIKKLAIKDSY